LLSYYRAKGFAVGYVPVRDHRRPPLDDKQLDDVWQAYQKLPKAVLVHCSAGCDRTGPAVEHIIAKLRGMSDLSP